MRISWLALPLAYGGALIVACSNDNTSAIKLGMTVPQGLLDNATRVDLDVVPGSAKCDVTTGRVSGSYDDDEVESYALQREGCAGGASWCRDITLERDGEPRVFGVVARAAGEVLGRGCAKVAIDKDPVEVRITIVAELQDRCCNDGIIQLGEQCDTPPATDCMQPQPGCAAPTDCGGNPVDATPGSCGGIIPDEVCECDCLSKEVLLSTAGGAVGLTADNKSELALAFAGPSGAQAGALRAVFTDRAGAHPDINFRVLAPDLYPLPQPFHQQLRVPLDTSCANPAQNFSRPRQQIQPDIARVANDQSIIVWADDAISMPGTIDLFGTWLNNTGCTDVQPAQLNEVTLTSVSFPAVAAGPTSTALVVWAQGGSVRGRIVTVPSPNASPAQPLAPTGSDLEIGTQLSGGRPKVAGNASGWVVVYAGIANDGDINFRTISPSGALGAEQRVNLVTDGVQEQPDVAMLADGRFAVVWRDRETTIGFQRFVEGAPIMGDQDQSLSESSPPGERPRIAASLDGGDFYAAVWATPSSAQVWGRMLAAQGTPAFRRNHVNGTLSEFVVNHPAIAAVRSEPTVAVGPQHLAFGWTGAPEGLPPSVFVRRFPHPAQ